MAQNHKLTRIIAGRTLSSSSRASNVLTIQFDDRSEMHVTLAPDHAPVAVPAGERIKGVRQQDCDFRLDLESGGVIALRTPDPASNVMLRDREGVLEYAD